MGLFLVWCHRLIWILLSVCKHACKEVCDVNPGIDPYPLLAWSCDRWWPDFVTFTACKKSRFGLKRGKKAQCVSNRCKDLFEWKKYFGVRCTFIVFSFFVLSLFVITGSSFLHTFWRSFLVLSESLELKPQWIVLYTHHPSHNRWLKTRWEYNVAQQLVNNLRQNICLQWKTLQSTLDLYTEQWLLIILDILDVNYSQNTRNGM